MDDVSYEIGYAAGFAVSTIAIVLIVWAVVKLISGASKRSAERKAKQLQAEEKAGVSGAHPPVKPE